MRICSMRLTLFLTIFLEECSILLAPFQVFINDFDAVS